MWKLFKIVIHYVATLTLIDISSAVDPSKRCPAVLVNTRWILTSLQCVVKDKLKPLEEMELLPYKNHAAFVSLKTRKKKKNGKRKTM